MLIWAVLIALSIGFSVLGSPWALALLGLALVTAVLPRAPVTMLFSCGFGALATPMLSSAAPSPDVWLLSILGWALVYLMLWLFVSTGLWRKRSRRVHDGEA